MYRFTGWDKSLPADQSLALLRDFGSRLLSGLIPSDYSKTLVHSYAIVIQMALESPDINDMLSISRKFSGDYSRFAITDVEAVATFRQIFALFQKVDFLDLGIDKELVAYRKFREAEQACHETNTFFRKLEHGSACAIPRLQVLLSKAQSSIRYILGGVPNFDRLPFVFGPGATTTIKQEKANLQMKLAEQPTCSENLARSAYLPAFLREFPGWLNEHQSFEYPSLDGYITAVIDVRLSTSKLVFVPKTAETHRTIMTQPTLNSILQLGVGNYMSRRLKKYAGIDISDQSLNQRLARAGSITGDLATIDLSSASDTISYGLVKYLLPEAWLNLLGGLRCPDYTVKGSKTPHRLEHFSAMGNGFTFPLETLIFYALARAVCGSGSTVAVYGDDIIVPSAKFDEVTWLLRCCGFTPNKLKSYASGPFRESCGADYFFGFDVRPVYLKQQVSARTLYTFHNEIWRRGWFRPLSSHVEEVLQKGSTFPVLYGPDGYGDGHLVTDAYVDRIRRTRKARRSGWSGFSFDTYRLKGDSTPSVYPGDLISPLYSFYARGGNPPIDVHLATGRDFNTGFEYSIDGRIMFAKKGISSWERTSIYALLPV